MKCIALSLLITALTVVGLYFLLPASPPIDETPGKAANAELRYDPHMVRLIPALGLGIIAGLITLIVSLRRTYPQLEPSSKRDDPFGLNPGVTPKDLGGAFFQLVARALKKNEPHDAQQSKSPLKRPSYAPTINLDEE